MEQNILAEWLLRIAKSIQHKHDYTAIENFTNGTQCNICLQTRIECKHDNVNLTTKSENKMIIQECSCGYSNIKKCYHKSIDRYNKGDYTYTYCLNCFETLKIDYI